MASSLRQVRAAILRAKAVRAAIIQVVLGTVFLVGALAHARAWDRHEQRTMAWMAGLVILSTLYVGLGLRTLARVRRFAASLWMAGVAAWGVLATALLGILLRS